MQNETFSVVCQVSDKELKELKESFMEAYDDNKDGKIEIREVSKTDQNQNLMNMVHHILCKSLPRLLLRI